MVERRHRTQMHCSLLGSCIATMGRRVGQKPVERMTEIIPHLVDPRNYLRKRSCAWPHSDRNRRRLPPPLPRTEAVHSREHPQQCPPTKPCNKSDRSLHSWELARDQGSRIVLQTVLFLRARGTKRAVAMTCRMNNPANKLSSIKHADAPSIII